MRSPTPEEVIAARGDRTQEVAAAVIYKDKSTWRRWEMDKSKKSSRDMDPAFFELYMLKTGQELKNVMKDNI